VPVSFSRTDYFYAEEAEYRRVERRTSALGSDNTQLEVEETFVGTCENVYARGRVKMRQARSGVQTHYAYESSALYGASYVQTAETRIDGEPVSGKSSREVKFISSDGNTLRSEKYLLDSAGTWQPVSSADFEYDAQNRETKRTRGNGRVSSREMMCCGTLWEVDEDGVRTDYVYDTAQQLTEKTRALTATQPERTTLYTRDAAGRVTREVLKLNSIDFSEKSAAYDALGRAISETDELGRTTTYAYALNATSKTRTETATLPSGATRITTTHADGTVLSEAGTSRRNTETAVDSVSDGIRTTRRIAGTTDDSGVLSREIKNGFGETIRTESPDTLGEFIYTRNSFDAFGRLTRSATDTLAPMLYEYDAFGNETKRTLVLADEPTALNSRITETSTQVENRADGVYRLVSTTTYNASGTALVTSVATLVSESATLESKTVSIDARGNVSTRWTEFGEPGVRISKTQIPTATNIAQTTTNDGFTVSQIDHAGTQTGFARQYNTGANAGIVLTTTDGRGNATTVEQNVLGWTTKTTDAAGNVTTTAYDLAHGKPSCVTDALGKTHCYAYDLHGNVVAEFGTGAQPVVFSFDDADNLVSQKLFRVPGETLESDPRSRTDLTADETTWRYHASTGLLLAKTYPDEGQIDYAYDAQNRLVSTTWTREVSEGVRLKATRTYAEKTGELVSVSYNDEATPTETHTYNHLGQLTQTVDAAGTRVYVYNNYNEVESETLTGNEIAHAVAELRDSFGRSLGYTYAKNGSVQQTTGTTYAAATGRIATASFVYAGAQKTFSYNYLAGTNLLESLVCPSNLTIMHAYEAKRDLVTGMTIRRGTSTNVVLRNYTYDALGRPLTRSTSRNGTTQNDTFGYNSRSELVSATLGTDNYAYAFDNIGNRATATVAIANSESQVSNYSTNNLNQYTGIVQSSSSSQEEGDRATSAVEALTYDADGNATLVRTSTGTWAIEYNGANRPIRFRNDSTDTTVDCGYDSQGRRYFKKVTVAGTTTLHHRYIYRGYLQIAALDVSLGIANAESKKKWDYSGKHTYGHQNQRP
ncbi:MAG: RHS repeat protein, partial [Opitutales bacterium]|nr:RHS repeat protein [Opitutales bacterium]